MSEKVPAVAIPEAIIVEQRDGFTQYRVTVDPFAPPQDRQSFERYIQRTGEPSEEVRGRGSDRASVRSRYVSMSPPLAADREVEIALANSSDRTIIGAPRSVWNQLISQYRRAALEDIDIEPPHLLLESLIRHFTRIALDSDPPAPPLDDDSDDETVPANYVECVFVRKTKTYHKVAVGPSGGKFFYDHNGQKKYIKAVGLGTQFQNPNQIPIVDNNPALITTALTQSP